MIELYSFPTPNGQKISIALEELGLAYTIVPINIARNDQLWPEFLAISPNNRIPAIVDLDPVDGNAPLPVFESGAILLYLARKTGRLVPSEPRREAKVLEWLMWQMAGFGPMLGQLGHFRAFAPERIEYATARYADEADRLYRVLDHRLAGREWVADTYSIADIAIAPWVHFRAVHQIELSSYPEVERWYAAFGARPAVVRGLAAGHDVWGDSPLSESERAELFLRGQPGD
ncbi:MAG: glutathione S-transferase N-terminal domain-containing protein [Deltaproteobacteria bacterium]|nr:glutathione S-transferase N-terminal domain-containing protein [Deltaproteobacteria bacterium]